MEGNPSHLGLNDNKIVYGKQDVNKTAAIFETLMISSEPKPKDLHSLMPGIRIQPPSSAEVADSGPHRKITREQLRDRYQTPSTNVSQEHIPEVQRRLREVRKCKKEKRQKDMMRANVKKKKEKEKEKKKKKSSTRVVDLKKQRVIKNESRMGRGCHQGDWAAKRQAIVELIGHSSPIKVRRSGKVQLSIILQNIIDILYENKAITYLFQKPVTIKEAPDYFDIVKQPMDLSIIKGKARMMQYKSHKEFRHDILQIVLNAHQYNVARNPDIPPLANRLLSLCDNHLEQYKTELEKAEAEIEVTDC